PPHTALIPSLSSAVPLRVLASFPTRRSSDLTPWRRRGRGRVQPWRTKAHGTLPGRCLASLPPASPRSGEPSLWEEGLPDTVLERSEEHTSELQSRENLVCRLLLEKKKKECIA